MNPRSTIGVGWVFVTEHQNFHLESFSSDSVDKMLRHYWDPNLLRASTVNCEATI